MMALILPLSVSPMVVVVATLALVAVQVIMVAASFSIWCISAYYRLV